MFRMMAGAGWFEGGNEMNRFHLMYQGAAGCQDAYCER